MKNVPFTAQKPIRLEAYLNIFTISIYGLSAMQIIFNISFAKMIFGTLSRSKIFQIGFEI